MAVAWQGTREPLPDRVLAGAELLLGVIFPSDYRDCVRVNHGGRPEPNGFVVPADPAPWGSGVGILLSLDPHDPNGVWGVLGRLGVDAQLPAGLVPVAEDGGGDFICLDYRGGPERLAVVYWSHEVGGEAGVVPVAETFGDFLSLLGREQGKTGGHT